LERYISCFRKKYISTEKVLKIFRKNFQAVGNSVGGIKYFKQKSSGEEG